MYMYIYVEVLHRIIHALSVYICMYMYIYICIYRSSSQDHARTMHRHTLNRTPARPRTHRCARLQETWMMRAHSIAPSRLCTSSASTSRCVCVCKRARERAREKETARQTDRETGSVCIPELCVNGLRRITHGDMRLM
jgi:hypothetical protein